MGAARNPSNRAPSVNSERSSCHCFVSMNRQYLALSCLICSRSSSRCTSHRSMSRSSELHQHQNGGVAGCLGDTHGGVSEVVEALDNGRPNGSIRDWAVTGAAVTDRPTADIARGGEIFPIAASRAPDMSGEE